MTKDQFESMVMQCKEYIAAGDIYQANLSQRLSALINDADTLRLYTILRNINPSPFAAYLDFGDLQLVGSSPERLVRLFGGIADTRPIAGTRRRGKNGAEMRTLSVELLTNEKERAEHIMLLDLERNDLGRVCEYGTVQVDEMMVVEDYSHVIHIVSNVRGTLAPGRDAFDLVRAVFPGGTITGVPKVRCMEIIDELEPMARGPYTGSIGYLSNAGDMDLNIIIRTFVVKDGIAAHPGRGRDRRRFRSRAGILRDPPEGRGAQEGAGDAVMRTVFPVATLSYLRYSTKLIEERSLAMFLVELVMQGVRGFREPARLRFQSGFNLVIAGNESGKTTAVDTMQRLLFPTSQTGAP